MVSSQTFDAFEGDRPLLLVFAPSEEDDRFDGQLLCINDEKEAFHTRRVIVYSVVVQGESTVGGEPLSRVDAESLRLRFGVGEADFLVSLIGRDGSEAARWSEPVPPGQLIAAIDRAARG